MIKKLIVYVILSCMALHCAGRLGLLDRLYQHRNEIAHALGLIKEIPIAMCSSDYDFDQTLKIKTDYSTHSLPSAIQAKEITLFFEAEYFQPLREQVLLSSQSFINPIDLYGFTSVTFIFHPPAA